MKFLQIVTDYVLPVVMAITAVGLVCLTVLVASVGSVGGAISTGALALLVSVFVAKDVQRLLAKK